MALITDGHIPTAQPRSKRYKLPCGNSLSDWSNPGGFKIFRYKYYVNRPDNDGQLVRVEDACKRLDISTEVISPHRERVEPLIVCFKWDIAKTDSRDPLLAA